MMPPSSDPSASSLPLPACTYALKPSLEDLRRGSFHCPECGLVFQVDPELADKWTALLLSALNARKDTVAVR